MARCFVEDTDEFFRVVTFSAQDEVIEKLGPYNTHGMAKSQGSRLTGKGLTNDPRAKTFIVQKLSVVEIWDGLTYLRSVLEWVDEDD